MFTLLLPPGVNPIVVNKCVIVNNIFSCYLLTCNFLNTYVYEYEEHMWSLKHKFRRFRPITQ